MTACSKMLDPGENHKIRARHIEKKLDIEQKLFSNGSNISWSLFFCNYNFCMQYTCKVQFGDERLSYQKNQFKEFLDITSKTIFWNILLQILSLQAITFVFLSFLWGEDNLWCKPQLNTMPASLKPERIFLLGMGEYVMNDIKRYITYV